MKNLLYGFLYLLILSKLLFAQVIISPYIVYMDDQNKYGSMIVQNESFDPYEISISFIFGYPVSDSLGNRTMKYVQNETDSLPSINKWIKAYPRKFVLNPKERQTIRLMIAPKANLGNGTYWTRIVTSSTLVENDTVESHSGVSAKLKFVLNQVTTAIFRKGDAYTNLIIKGTDIIQDSTNTNQLLVSLKREGNSPFFGYLNLKIFNSENKIIKEERDYLSIYYDMVKNYILPTDKFTTGNYRAEIDIEFNEKEDIPESKMGKIPNVKKSFEFNIP